MVGQVGASFPLSDFRGKPQFFSMRKLRQLLTWARKNKEIIVFNFSGKEMSIMKPQWYIVNYRQQTPEEKQH